MNVFIVGASGYIGRAVTAHVLRAGHSVTAWSAPKRLPHACPLATCGSWAVRWRIWERSRGVWVGRMLPITSPTSARRAPQMQTAQRCGRSSGISVVHAVP
jgi:hypothetical protein